MSNKKCNWPNADIDASGEEMTAMMRSIADMRKLEPIDSRDINQLNERITYYFDYCAEHSLRPTISLLAACIGIDRTNLWRWSQQEDERGEVIRRTRGIIEALLEGWGVSGKINPAAMIFLLKNHFNYADNFTIEAVRKDEYADVPTAEEIVKKLPEVDRAALTDDLISKL